MRKRSLIPYVDSPGLPIKSRNGTELPPYSTIYYFDQLIDHNNPSLGTFKQRYWHTYEFYEPGKFHSFITSFGLVMPSTGGPIILMTPGEANAQGYNAYLSNQTINGMIAQQQNGSTVILEHRFYGLSNPKPDLTVASLQYHTIQQAIDDLVYFVYNVNLPMPGGESLSPSYAPWILVGGSYAGALTSWTMVNKPNVFWAGYASSAVVEAILDFWQYFEPIREHMPQNCSADVQAVVQYVDQVFTSGDSQKTQEIKDLFGMDNVTHSDDASGALRNNLWDWQSLQPSSGPGAAFFKFCDALEVKNGESAPASGWGAQHAVSAWGNYFKGNYTKTLCGNQTVLECVGTYNASQSIWTNTTIDNPNRSWMWIVCNQVGYLQDCAPPSFPTLVSRLIQPPYDLRQCQLMFPEAFPEPPSTVNTQKTNDDYRGWNVELKRLFFANGQRDPWREATMSAAPVTVKSTAYQPIMIGDGFHCSDLKAVSGQDDPTVRAVQESALAYMKTWLAEWTPPTQVSTNAKRTVNN
ncbi:hypothetical protein AX14_000237 [Amanita brunnescens Koide BX004]|nr:hypothetical protein AX14_000237 [Amanita brunnescens Koide BX004]